jgi:hypothetical protein
VTILEISSYLGALALAVVVVWSIVVMFDGPGILTGINASCGKNSVACGAEVGFLIPLLSVALASAIFLYRFRRVTSPVVRRAKTKPQHLVETATPDIGEIVGRDELCRVIMEDIHHSETRRPHLLVGGVGAGKTAVLVRLTRLFAKHRAVPVPIRLRDATDSLNFREMAHTRFLAMAESSMLSADDAEKVWRQLSKDDKIVVIADGLEEALTEGSASVHEDRDNLIRLAIERAHELRLPLIIASRPHDPLRGADATIMELEPLSEEAALEYIDPGQNSADARWLDWIVETAGLTELPLYLQITRQLFRSGRLDYVSAERPARADMRSMDRSKLRVHLLDTWMKALFDGHLMGAVSLNRSEREAAVQWLSALACIGLLRDSIDVKYEDYYKGKTAHQLELSHPTPKYPEIDREVQKFLKDKLPRRPDIRLAVTWGDRLNLVEAHGEGLRFPHSIMQAYLASRFMSTALQDPGFRRDAETRLRSPGREFLIALVLYARSVDSDQEEQAGSEPEAASAARQPAAAAKSRAAGASGAGAVTVASMLPGPAQDPSNRRIPSASPPTRKVQDSFESVLAGKAPDSSGPVLSSDVRSIRDVLWSSAKRAKDDVKKLDLYAATLEIDSFLDESQHREIAKCVADGWEGIRGGDQRTIDEAKLGLVYRFGDAARTVADRPDRGLSKLDPAYEELLEIGRGELSYPIRLAIAQEIGTGGDKAFRVLRQPYHNAPGNTWQNPSGPNGTANGGRPSRSNGQSGNTDKNRTLRERTLYAWLTPLLVGSVHECESEARQELGLWLGRVGRDQEGGGIYFHLSVEVALAQGFKYAANRRLRHPHALPATRDYMAEQAMEMLSRARFWFTQLTLIQALCLWEMPDPGMPQDDKTGRRANGSKTAENGVHRHGSDPEATVGHWLEVARNGKHPFVAEAGKLAVEALKTGHPERFLWIDESGVVSSVGSRASQACKDRKHHLWIPPSAGWAALDPRAQQLVADVLLLLNLAERVEGPEIEQRLRRVKGNDLPLCFTRNRDPLDPKATVGGLFKAPGRNCIDGCGYRLCPYPAYGGQPYRSELDEAFCRGQQTLLSRGLSAPWQTVPRANLKRFWAQMADRARGVNTDRDLD